MTDETRKPDWELAQQTAKMIRSLEEAQQYVERFGVLYCTYVEQEKCIAKLERQEADGERDAELLDLLVAWWTGNATAATGDRIRALLEERTPADGLAHNPDVA